MDEQPQTFSIQLRLRREVVEDAYVAVLVSDKVMRPKADGGYELDVEKLTAEAIRLGGAPGVDWQTESSRTEPHPLQTPLPAGRTVLDGRTMTE